MFIKQDGSTQLGKKTVKCLFLSEDFYFDLKKKKKPWLLAIVGHVQTIVIAGRVTKCSVA